MMMMGGRYASALETENAMAAMAAKTRAKFRMSITPGSFPQCPKDGESVHPRQTHIYENGRCRKRNCRGAVIASSPAESRAGLDLALARDWLARTNPGLA